MFRWAIIGFLCLGFSGCYCKCCPNRVPVDKYVELPQKVIVTQQQVKQVIITKPKLPAKEYNFEPRIQQSGQVQQVYMERVK